jgi:hypothetical protein
MPHFFAIIATRSHNNLNHNLCQKSVQTQVFAGAVESSMLINSAWADASRGKLFSKKKQQAPWQNQAVLGVCT